MPEEKHGGIQRDRCRRAILFLLGAQRHGLLDRCVRDVALNRLTRSSALISLMDCPLSLRFKLRFPYLSAVLQNSQHLLVVFEAKNLAGEVTAEEHRVIAVNDAKAVLEPNTPNCAEPLACS